MILKEETTETCGIKSYENEQYYEIQDDKVVFCAYDDEKDAYAFVQFDSDIVDIKEGTEASLEITKKESSYCER